MVRGRYSFPEGTYCQDDSGKRPHSGRTRKHSPVFFRDGETDVLRAEKEEKIIKSLQLEQDERYEAMDYYSAHGGTADKTGHFARICRANRQLHALEKEHPHIKHTSNFEEVAGWEIENDEYSWPPRQSVTPAVHVDPRVQWQESFDGEVKKLFVDFKLTSSPNCRLNHLERMHDWFTEHGQKQTRKNKRGPSFLTVDRTLPLPPGSTANIPRLDLAARHAFSTPFYSPGLSSRSSRRS